MLFAVFHKRIKENADITRVRSKRANKVAQKRLKKAAQRMKTGENEAFYTEIERALWTYLSDRLSVPTADLNKDNIATILRGKGVGEEIIAEVNRVLSDAEFARYAPSAAQSKEQLYKAATQIIDQLESKA